MISWHQGTKSVRLANLVDHTGTPVVETEDFKRRLTEPHVIELAASIKALGGRPAALPVVHWPPKGPLERELVAGWDRTAALVINGLKAHGLSPDLDGALEVRSFEGTPADIERLREDENIHRRQDRDRWLRLQVEREAGKLAAARADDSKLPIETDDAEGGGATGAPEPQKALASPPEAPPKHKWAHGMPNTTACKAPGEKVTAWEDVTCLACLALGREWGSVKDPEQQAGAPPRPLTPSKADKTAARKKVAEKAGTTVAAVKQAEQRDRAKRGETSPRKKHDDSGPALDADQLRRQRVFIDALASVEAAITRIANHTGKQPDAVLKVQLAGLRGWRDDFKAARAKEGL